MSEKNIKLKDSETYAYDDSEILTDMDYGWNDYFYCTVRVDYDDQYKVRVLMKSENNQQYIIIQILLKSKTGGESWVDMEIVSSEDQINIYNEVIKKLILERIETGHKPSSASDSKCCSGEKICACGSII